MSKTFDPIIDRRGVLKGAGVVGATVVSGSGMAAMFAPSVQGVSVAYWDGTRLVSADRISAGSKLSELTITLESHGRPGDLREIDAMFSVKVAKSSRSFPFMAWMAGGDSVRVFTMPSNPTSGISFAVKVGTSSSDPKIPVQLGVSGLGPKLKEGTYVIAAGNVNWSNFRFEPESPNGPLLAAGGRPTSQQYVTIKIERS